LKLSKKHPKFLKFYQNFQQLDNLETLEIRFSSGCRQEDYTNQNYLTQQILQRIPTLKRLVFLGAFRRLGLAKTSESLLLDSYLPQLFESGLPSLTHTLQTLEIGHRNVVYSDFDLSLYRNKFMNLSKIKVYGRFDKEENYLKMRLFLEEIISLGSSIVNVQVNTVVSNTVESLLDLLKELKNLKKPKKVQIELGITFIESNSLRPPKSGFNKIINELKEDNEQYPKLEGVFVVLPAHYDSGKMKEFINAYKGKFESLNNF